MIHFLSWKIQKAVLISISSLVGMVALLWIFPTKTKQNRNLPSSFQAKDFSTYRESHSSQVDLKSSPKNKESSKNQNFTLDFYKEFVPKEFPLSIQKLEMEKQNEFVYSFSSTNFSMNVFRDYTLPNFQERALFGNSQANPRFGNYFFNINYKIYPYLFTEITFQHNTYSFQMNRDYSSLSTGIQLKPNQYFSASFLTGETFLYLNSRLNQSSIINYLDKPYMESPERKNRFELRSEFRPFKNLFLQASIYNTDQLYDELNSGQGTKFVFGYGFNFFQFNLKYNYLGNQFLRNGRVFDNNPQNRDAGGVGVTIFLDRKQNLSLYLGNNYFNLFHSPRYEDKSNLPYTTSYSASLRGRTFQRGFLFLNFRNQISKDMQYMNFGTLRVPLQTIYQDTATSLGLELWF